MNNIDFNFYNNIFSNLCYVANQWGASNVYPPEVCNGMLNALSPSNIGKVSYEIDETIRRFYYDILQKLRMTYGDQNSYTSEALYTAVRDWAESSITGQIAQNGWFRQNDGRWVMNNRNYVAGYERRNAQVYNYNNRTGGGAGYVRAPNGMNRDPRPMSSSGSGIYSANPNNQNDDWGDFGGCDSTTSTSYNEPSRSYDAPRNHETPRGYEAPRREAPSMTKPINSIHSSGGRSQASGDFSRRASEAPQAQTYRKPEPAAARAPEPSDKPVEHFTWSQFSEEEEKAFAEFATLSQYYGFEVEKGYKGVGDASSEVKVFDMKCQSLCGSEKELVDRISPIFAEESSYTARISYEQVTALRIDPLPYNFIRKYFTENYQKVIDSKNPGSAVDKIIYLKFIGEQARYVESLLVKEINRHLRSTFYSGTRLDNPLMIDKLKDFDELIYQDDLAAELGSAKDKWAETARCVLGVVLKKFFTEARPIMGIDDENFYDIVHCNNNIILKGLNLRDVIVNGNDEVYGDFFKAFFDKYVVLHVKSFAVYSDLLEDVKFEGISLPYSENNSLAENALFASLDCASSSKDDYVVSLGRVVKYDVLPLYNKNGDEIDGYRITCPISPRPSKVIVKDSDYSHKYNKPLEEDLADAVLEDIADDLAAFERKFEEETVTVKESVFVKETNTAPSGSPKEMRANAFSVDYSKPSNDPIIDVEGEAVEGDDFPCEADAVRYCDENGDELSPEAIAEINALHEADSARYTDEGRRQWDKF